MLQSWVFGHWGGRSHTGYFTFHSPAIVAAVNISMCKNVHRNLNCTRYLTWYRTGTYGNYVYCNVFLFCKAIKHG